MTRTSTVAHQKVKVLSTYIWITLALGAASAHGSSFFEIPDSRGLEFSGAAATDRNNQVLLVGDDTESTLFLHEVGPINNDTLLPSTSRVDPLVFARNPNEQIDNLEGLTRRPRDGKYFMTAGMALPKSCGSLAARSERFGSFKLIPSGREFTVVELAVRVGLRNAVINFLRADPTLGSVDVAAEFNPPQVGGLNIEALAFVPIEATPPSVANELDTLRKDGALLLGLRGPLDDTPPPPRNQCETTERPVGSGSALYVYFLNPDEFLAGANARLRGPIDPRVAGRVFLNGLGFRDATMVPGALGERLLIVAGNVAGSGEPAAFVYDTQTAGPTAPRSLLLPMDTGARAIEAVVLFEWDGVTSLAFYEDTGTEQRQAALFLNRLD